MNILKDLIKNRRSIYNLSKNGNFSHSKITKTIENCLLYAPSAFNSQSSRIVILYDKKNDEFWDFVAENIKKITSEEQFLKTKEKLNSFKSGIGTILFFEDEKVINNYMEKFSLYKDNFYIWANQSSAMLQYMVWISLYELNIGASLQHYNEIIEKDLNHKFDISESWKIIAQMPFGTIEKPAEEKVFENIEKRIKVLD